MKRMQIFLTIIILFILITFLGPDTPSHFKAYTPVEYSQSVTYETALNEFNFESLAKGRNAQKEKASEVKNSSTPQKELVGEFKLTFYSPTTDQTDSTPNITASGAEVKPGVTVAVDPRYWKLGTKFYVEGYGYVVAEDTGSMIKGPRTMDVCVETRDQALKNGVQFRNVWVVQS